MNINNFDYTKVPYSQIKKFQIHPLSDKGKSKYITKLAYTHKYLRAFQPSRSKEIFNFKNDDDEEEEDNPIEIEDETYVNANHLSDSLPNITENHNSNR